MIHMTRSFHSIGHIDFTFTLSTRPRCDVNIEFAMKVSSAENLLLVTKKVVTEKGGGKPVQCHKTAGFSFRKKERLSHNPLPLN